MFSLPTLLFVFSCVVETRRGDLEKADRILQHCDQDKLGQPFLALESEK